MQAERDRLDKLSHECTHATRVHQTTINNYTIPILLRAVLLTVLLAHLLAHLLADYIRALPWLVLLVVAVVAGDLIRLSRVIQSSTNGILQFRLVRSKTKRLCCSILDKAPATVWKETDDLYDEFRDACNKIIT